MKWTEKNKLTTVTKESKNVALKMPMVATTTTSCFENMWEVACIMSMNTSWLPLYVVRQTRNKQLQLAYITTTTATLQRTTCRIILINVPMIMYVATDWSQLTLVVLSSTPTSSSLRNQNWKLREYLYVCLYMNSVTCHCGASLHAFISRSRISVADSLLSFLLTHD